MSTGCECAFIEVQPGRWFYLLEHYHASKNSWDWREHATAYGPFASKDAAYEHLRDNHPNPGGYGIMPYREGYKPDAVMAALIAKASNRARAEEARRWAYQAGLRNARRMF